MDNNVTLRNTYSLNLICFFAHCCEHLQSQDLDVLETYSKAMSDYTHRDNIKDIKDTCSN